MGMLEVLEDSVKRLTPGVIHLESGLKLNVTVLFKLFGFNGDWEVDRVMGVKEMEGFWVNSDFRRHLNAEAIGVNANNFGGTSFSPAARQWVMNSSHFFWYPKDFQPLLESGMLAKHKAEPEQDRPAYVLDARYATGCSVVIGSMCVGIAEENAKHPWLKRMRQLEAHPLEVFLGQCKAEWDEYARKWKDAGAPGPIPEYPYTPKLVQEYLDQERIEMGF